MQLYGPDTGRPLWDPLDQSPHWWQPYWIENRVGGNPATSAAPPQAGTYPSRSDGYLGANSTLLYSVVWNQSLTIWHILGENTISDSISQIILFFPLFFWFWKRKLSSFLILFKVYEHGVLYNVYRYFKDPYLRSPRLNTKNLTTPRFEHHIP